MDYRKYRCNLWERLGCLAAGTAVAAAIAWLFYRSWYGMVLVIPVNYLIVSYYKNKKRDERAKKLMIEFRDAIQAVAAALLAGYSIEHAWKEAERTHKSCMSDKIIRKRIYGRHVDDRLI